MTALFSFRLKLFINAYLVFIPFIPAVIPTTEESWFYFEKTVGERCLLRRHDSLVFVSYTPAVIPTTEESWFYVEKAVEKRCLLRRHDSLVFIPYTPGCHSDNGGILVLC